MNRTQMSALFFAALAAGVATHARAAEMSPLKLSLDQNDADRPKHVRIDEDGRVVESLRPIPALLGQTVRVRFDSHAGRGEREYRRYWLKNVEGDAFQQVGEPSGPSKPTGGYGTRYREVEFRAVKIGTGRVLFGFGDRQGEHQLVRAISLEVLSPKDHGERMKDEALAVRRFKGYHGGIKEVGEQVIEDATTWEKVWKQVHATLRPLPKLPEVDFERQIVLAVFMGGRNTGGYSIDITHVKDAGKFLEVSVRRMSPDARDVTTQALTAPYDMLVIEKPGKPVRFVVKDAKRPDAHGVIVTFNGEELNGVESKTTNGKFRPEFEKRLAELAAKLPGEPNAKIVYWYKAALNGCAIQVEQEPENVERESKELLEALAKEPYVKSAELD